MNTTTTQFLRSDQATTMYTSPGHTYARVGVRDPARMYVRGRIFFLVPWLYVRVHATCAPLLRHVHAYTTTRALPYSATVHRCSLQTDRSTSMYVHVRDQNDNAKYASTRWVLTVRHFLACEDVAGRSQQSGGNVFFTKYGGPVQWVPAVRWRNHYFSRNKEALPCCHRGPSCQPLHVQSTSDGSRSLTMLTTPHREHQGSGRR